MGPQGLTEIAASGIDMAAWDALAKANGLPIRCLRACGGLGIPYTAAR